MEAPKGFIPAGLVLSAFVSKTAPPFIRKRKYRGARAKGVNYERKTHPYLNLLYPEVYVANPWLNFQASGSEKRRWCQPDGLIINAERGIITCVEIKYSHTADAWFQTRQLYVPVLQCIFPESLWDIQICEVVKWYDPSVAFPENITLTQEPARPTGKFKVHIYKP